MGSIRLRNEKGVKGEEKGLIQNSSGLQFIVTSGKTSFLEHDNFEYHSLIEKSTYFEKIKRKALNQLVFGLRLKSDYTEVW